MIVKALVPDTNFWLHARRPFDFQAIAGGERYVVAVPTKVLNELDEKQHEGRRGLRSRARPCDDLPQCLEGRPHRAGSVGGF